MGKKTHDSSVSVPELQKRSTKSRALLSELRAQFPEVTGFARDDRVTSQGKMGLDEAKVLRSVVAAMDDEPAIFGVLADEDEGHDPNKLETSLIRDRFDRHEVYTQIAEDLKDLAAVFSDAALEMGALVKPIALAGYEIAKPFSKRHKGIREKIAPALDYYGANAAASVAARGANKPVKDGQ